MALGLGELKLESFLNEPLEASVDLLNVGGLHQDEIKIRLATREDFEKLGLDRAYFLTNITFEVVIGDNGKARIVMGSDDPVLEPYLDFIVEARWPTGRLLREYTILIDPPVFAESTTVVSASQRVEEVEGIPAPGKKKPGGAAGSSGTSVKVRKSELPQGQMPQRDYNAAATGSPISGSRYMISRDDTLWDIASRAKPAGVSVHQTMLDIQRLNPQAFINGNINRVKAGYIVYLPTADDISSGDVSAAMTEVNEQNAAWREQRDAERYADSGPALRISAESNDTESGSARGGSSNSGSNGSMVDGEVAEAMALAGAESANRVAAMQQQLETLQRIVNLKDEQIAALQNALGDSEGSGDAAAELEQAAEEAAELEAAAASLEDSMAAEVAAVEMTEESGELELELDVSEPEVVAAPAPVKPEPKAKPKAPSKPAASDQGGNWFTYLLYGAGALLLGLFAFLFVRSRRSDEDDDDDLESFSIAPATDVFSNVKLQEEELEVDLGLEGDEGGEDVASALPAGKDGSAGYGERKHDQYASDSEASDALAEADIYIAYGRHPQAIDLLNNALVNEPANPVYRLKLIEVYTEIGDRGAAAAQLEQLLTLGDSQASAQGEAIINRTDDPIAQVTEVTEPGGDRHGGPGLSPNPFQSGSGAEEGLESEFSDLEIEEFEDDGELDLTSDFEESDDDGDDEDLVIAADANGLSTKMDLARAYIDMGDDDGARQILEEVVAEGSDELKAEAQALLDSVGE